MERLNQWLTLIANFGVIFGILLLVLELNQARTMMQAQTRNALSDKVVELISLPVGDNELLEIILKDRAGEDLSDLEALKFQHRNNAFFRYWENVHYQYRQGLYEEVEFRKQLAAIGAYMNTHPSAVTQWCRDREMYSPEFVHAMNSLIAVPGCL